jgi:hypothetical protein
MQVAICPNSSVTLIIVRLHLEQNVDRPGLMNFQPALIPNAMSGLEFTDLAESSVSNRI